MTTTTAPWTFAEGDAAFRRMAGGPIRANLLYRVALGCADATIYRGVTITRQPGHVPTWRLSRPRHPALVLTRVNAPHEDGQAGHRRLATFTPVEPSAL
ncbi:hypothetical protein [Oryzihumus leptocrescens]|uniref:Uncharacterized protein n=1 Tax=Oryzihumus leptocrescens TaxID=297536 RepID=A0A542ZEP3_9MICO|nr:hypothetical protein [Oryzihumus leptocrescens]TQL58771.1 hypothetical protein FB474_0108 [Oryzihumus leptocrescens]